MQHFPNPDSPRNFVVALYQILSFQGPHDALALWQVDPQGDPIFATMPDGKLGPAENPG